MGDGFRLTFATTMTPWTQDCMFFVAVTLSGLSFVGAGARPPSAEKPDRFPWYTYLVQRALAEGRHDAALLRLSGKFRG